MREATPSPTHQPCPEGRRSPLQPRREESPRASPCAPCVLSDIGWARHPGVHTPFGTGLAVPVAWITRAPTPVSGTAARVVVGDPPGLQG
ncbi:TPA: hypothetical protein N0F65_002701 [Lagenidium giganteum]|uniref:Uncharacterized protein n=1 Tax=Lagenidium giganteum TaxID=4803 RepID=A0AAV2Z0J0_9STRA|nr:TPA: hypothetical protein N0F65_002701 [Lagenidium giganteum]